MSQKGFIAIDEDPPPDDEFDEDPPPDDEFDEDPPPDDEFDEDPPPDDEFDEDLPPDDDFDEDPPPDDEFDEDPPPDDDDESASVPTTLKSNPPIPNDDDDIPPPDDDDIPPPDDDDASFSSSSDASFAETKRPPPPPTGPSRASLVSDNLASLMTSTLLTTIVEDELDDVIGPGFNKKGNTIVDDSPVDEEQTEVIELTPEVKPVESTAVRESDSRASIRSSMALKRPSPEEVQRVAHAAMTEGFIEISGKFEGDSFERLFVKVLNNIFLIRVETGHEIEFNLIEKKVIVTEDPQDEYCFVMEVDKRVIIFMTVNLEDRSNLLSQMPKQVVDVSYSAQNEEDLAVEKKSNKKDYVYPDENDKKSQLKMAGKSIDDLLEGGASILPDAGKGSPMAKVSFARQERVLFSSCNSSVAEDNRATENSPRKVAYNRIELINSHIKQPVYSVRRAKQLCKWINGLHIWHSQVTLTNLHDEFCNGLLLRSLMLYLQPDVTIPINEKPLTTALAQDNLEKILGLILRSKHVNKSRIPTAKDLLYGSSAKLVVLLQELFDVYLRKPLYSRAVKVMKWYDSVLRPFNATVPEELFKNGDVGSVWSLFQSGTLLFKIIYYFYAYATIGEGMNIVAVDSLRIFERPSSISEFRSNMIYVFSLLRALKVEVIWDADDWISYPDTEFILLQLTYIYDVMKDLSPSLPPAENGNPGITSGPNGTSQVVGMAFADTVVSNVLPKFSKGVLIGSGDNALPFLPIDITGRNPRFVCDICPMGLMASKDRLSLINSPLASSPTKERERWNVGTKSDISSENNNDKPLVDIFKRHYQRLFIKNSHDHSNAVVDGSDSVSTSSAASGGHQLFEMEEDKFRRGRVELDEMMQLLEDDIYKSEDGMTSLEEDLTARYLELESLSESIDVQDYTTRLAALEEERFKLEIEKDKLQEHFARRLQSIKVRQSELEAREQSFANSNSNQGQASPGAKSSLKFTSPNSKSISKPIHQSIEKEKLAERGWISEITKSETMNFHLRKLSENSAKNLLDSWTPKSSKLKGTPGKSPVPTSPSRSGLNKSGEKQKPINSARGNDQNIVALKLLSGHNPVNIAFHKFLVQLKKVDDEWKGPKKVKNVDYTIYHPSFELKRESKDLVTGDLIAVPSSGYQVVNSTEINDVIRKESLSTMRLEDERRKRWYHYQKLNSVPGLLSNQLLSQSSMSPGNNAFLSNNSTHNNNSNNTSYFGSPNTTYNNSGGLRDSRLSLSESLDMSPSSTMNKSATRSSAQKEEKNTEEWDTIDKIDASVGLQWLAIPRPLILSDRKNREFLFLVTELTHRNSERGDKDKTWSLVWREPSLQFTDHSAIVGQLSLTNIKDVCLTENDPTTLLITIIESPKALRLTGGRPSIMLKCKSSGECAKYRNTLKTVIKAIALGMKLD